MSSMTGLLLANAEAAQQVGEHHEVSGGVTALFAVLLVAMIAALALEEKIHAKKSVIVGVFAGACLVLAVEAEGTEVETIEGMADGDQLHPLQQKFLDHAALQCGVCTPGFLVAAKSLLERNPDPTETEVRYWLAGNLCRCTGYDKIVRAVLDTAAEMRG